MFAYFWLRFNCRRHLCAQVSTLYVPYLLYFAFFLVFFRCYFCLSTYSVQRLRCALAVSLSPAFNQINTSSFTFIQPATQRNVIIPNYILFNLSTYNFSLARCCLCLAFSAEPCFELLCAQHTHLAHAFTCRSVRFLILDL